MMMMITTISSCANRAKCAIASKLLRVAEFSANWLTFANQLAAATATRERVEIFDRIVRFSTLFMNHDLLKSCRMHLTFAPASASAPHARLFAKYKLLVCKLQHFRRNFWFSMKFYTYGFGFVNKLKKSRLHCVNEVCWKYNVYVRFTLMSEFRIEHDKREKPHCAHQFATRRLFGSLACSVFMSHYSEVKAMCIGLPIWILVLYGMFVYCWEWRNLFNGFDWWMHSLSVLAWLVPHNCNASQQISRNLHSIQLKEN